MSLTVAESRPRESGFTLSELLVAMTLGLIVTGGALVVFQHAVRASQSVKQKLDMHDNIRIALDLMVRDFVQVGQGLPAGKVVAIPSGVGALTINRPGPEGANLTFAAGATELPAVTPGDALGVAINGLTTDMLNVIYADSQFDLAQATIAADGESATVDAAVPIAGVPDPIRAGDLIMFTNAQGSTLMMVTGTDDPATQTIYFADGDPMGLNQRGADAGTIMQLNPTPGADFTAQLTRMRMVTYYIDNANPDQPRLVRRVNMNPGRVVAVGLDNLQFSYDLVDGITNPTNQDDPATPNQVRKINIVVGARSRERSVLLVGRPEVPEGQQAPDPFFRASLTSQVSLRSLALVDRYQ